MKEAHVGGDQPLIAHDQTANMAPPRERALDDPPPALAPPLPAILMRGVFVVTPGRDTRVDAAPSQARPQGMAVIPAIGDQPRGPLAGPTLSPPFWRG
jgi:hypothetical protein